MVKTGGGVQASIACCSTSNVEEEYYAIRRGKLLNNCVFLRWEDAKQNLPIDDNDDDDYNFNGHDYPCNYDRAKTKMEYSKFTAIEDALEYLVEAISSGQGRDEVIPAYVRVYDNTAATGTCTSTAPSLDLYPSACSYSSSSQTNSKARGAGAKANSNSKSKYKYKYKTPNKTPKGKKNSKAGGALNNTSISISTNTNTNSSSTAKQKGNQSAGPATTDQMEEEGVEFDVTVDDSSNDDHGHDPGRGRGRGQEADNRENQNQRRGNDQAPASSVVKTGERKPTKQWMFNFEKVKEYKRVTGSFEINENDKESTSLKRWMEQQRYQYRCKMSEDYKNTSRLSDEKIQMLTDIGFHFDYYSFDDRIGQLKKFKERHGTTDVPIDDPVLGGWMEKQRRQLILYNKGQKSRMNDEKVQKLKDVGFDVENISKPIKKPRQETQEKLKKWEDMFEKLKQYKDEKGTCTVSKYGDQQPLWKWVVQQRSEYKKLRNNLPTKMTAVKMQRLNDIGFKFNPGGIRGPNPPYISWEERMNQLREFKEQHGHVHIPVTDAKLGEFVSRQRAEYIKRNTGKKSSMSDSRLKDLQDIGFIFRVAIEDRTLPEGRKSWDDRYTELLDYKAAYGHTLVSQKRGLGEWVHKQRTEYKQLKEGKPSKLSMERALKLADAGFIFDASAYRRRRTMYEGPIPNQEEDDMIMDNIRNMFEGHNQGGNMTL